MAFVSENSIKLSDDQKKNANNNTNQKVRCLAAAPWFSLVFSLPASIVTWVAWRSRLRARPEVY